MFKELNPFIKERLVKSLGKRELPKNPNTSQVPFRVDYLSENARHFWELRGYGAFVISIITDETIKTAISELGHEETQLLVRYLIGKLAAGDRHAVRVLPKNHPDRKAFAEILQFEKRRESEIMDNMVSALAEKTGNANAGETAGLISHELAGAADDVKRTFFRVLTREVGAVERDQLIASRLRSRAAQIARIREQAISKSG